MPFARCSESAMALFFDDDSAFNSNGYVTSSEIFRRGGFVFLVNALGDEIKEMNFSMSDVLSMEVAVGLSTIYPLKTICWSFSAGKNISGLDCSSASREAALMSDCVGDCEILLCVDVQIISRANTGHAEHGVCLRPDELQGAVKPHLQGFAEAFCQRQLPK